MASAAEEVAGLDRVLTRLGITEENQLEKVLSKLLPTVIGMFKSPHELTKKKILEILSHVNKRVKDQKQIKLPVTELLQQFLDPSTAPMAKNFALVYTEMAFDRASPTEQVLLVGKILTDVSARSPQHAALCLRMAVAGLAAFTAPISITPAVTKEVLEKYPFLASAADRTVFLSHATKLMLYSPQTTKPAAAQLAATAAAAAAAVAPGLVVGDPMVTNLMGLMSRMAAASLSAQDLLLPFQAAACDTNDAVAKRGDDLVRRSCGIDSAKPAVDLEDASLVGNMFALFHGTPPDSLLPADQKVSPASIPLRTRLVNLLSKSLAAANTFPAALHTVSECVFGRGSSARLKSGGMEFAVWVFKHASDDNLAGMGPDILQGLLSALDDMASTTDTATMSLRGFVYQAIGQLAQRCPRLFTGDVDIAARFFHALSEEAAGVRATVQEAASALSEAYRGLGGEQLEALRQLLLTSIASTKDVVRMSAVQWAAKLFPLSDVPSRYVCILACGDDKHEVREAARKALQPAQPNARLATEQAAPPLEWPDLQAVLDFVCAKHPGLRNAPDSMRSLPLPSRSFQALIQLLQDCKKAAAKKLAAAPSADPEVLPDAQSVQLPVSYLVILEHALVREAGSELVVAALQALLDAGETAPEVLTARYATRTAWLKGFLGHIDAAARLAAAKLLGVAAAGMAGADVEALLAGLLRSFPASVLPAGAAGSDEKPTVHAKFEEQDGSILAVGFVAAQHSSSQAAAASSEVLQRSAAALVGVVGGGNATLAGSAVLSLGHMGLAAPLPLPETATDSSPSLGDALAKVATLTQSKEPKVAARAVAAAGYLAAGDPRESTLSPLVDALLALAPGKAEEVQFAVGEALAWTFGGVSVPPRAVLRSNFVSLAFEFDIYKAPSQGGDAMEVDSGPVAEASGEATHADDPSRAAMRDKILDKIMKEFVFHSRQEVRVASCVWLVSLLTYTSQHPRLMAMLPELQEAFSTLLGDSSELAQEMASRGVSLVYRLGGPETRQKLVGQLVGVLQGGAQAKKAVKLTAETKVFEEGQLGQAPGGGNLSTYQELCSLATEMGQPDLVYRFMDLAHHQAALNSRRGAAFGFAGIAKLAGEALAPHVAALVPKLYRYQYDPNPRVQEAMAGIWRALVDDPGKVLTAQLDQVVQELLNEMVGRLWRNRQSSALALADLMQGRRWPEVRGWFAEAWSRCFRVLDDTKETVQQAGTTLARALKGVTLRLVDPTHCAPSEAAEAVAVVLPLMLEKGLVSSVSDIRFLAVETIAKLVKTAGPEQSLSSLEDSRLNYIEQHAERLGLDSGRLEDVRVAASTSSPLGDALDLAMRYTDVPTLELLLPALTGLVKRGVGLNTRAGTARFIRSLATRMASDIRPHAATLIKALLVGARSERSANVRRGLASAAAAVAKYAAEKRVAKLVEEAVEMYTEPGDLDARMVGGLVLKELLRSVPEAFQAHAAAVLPLAFMARNDEDADVAVVWKEVWEEGVSSESAALRLYSGELTDSLLAALASQHWGRKKAAAKALVSMAEVGGSDAMSPHAERLARSLLAEASGRLWEGKESLLEGLGALAKASPQALAVAPGHDAVIDGLIAALARKKNSYRQAALAALEKALGSFQADFYARVSPPLLEACVKHTTKEATPPPVEKPAGDDAAAAAAAAAEEEAAEKPLPLPETLRCLAAAWKPASAATVAAHGTALVAAATAVLRGNHPWSSKLEAVQLSMVIMRHGDLGTVPEQDRASWISDLASGLAVTASDGKVQQLRAAAVEAVQAAVTSGGALLAPAVAAELEGVMEGVAEGDKSASVRAEALKAKNMLSAIPRTMDT